MQNHDKFLHVCPFIDSHSSALICSMVSSVVPVYEFLVVLHAVQTVSLTSQFICLLFAEVKTLSVYCNESLRWISAPVAFSDNKH